MLNLEIHEYQVFYNKKKSNHPHTQSFLNTVQHYDLKLETRGDYYIVTGKPEELYKFIYTLNLKYSIKIGCI